jgi:hypothetical protein
MNFFLKIDISFLKDVIGRNFKKIVDEKISKNVVVKAFNGCVINNRF